MLRMFMLALLALGWMAPLQAQINPEFTYQGVLKQNGSLANGLYDFEVAVYDAASGGTQIGSNFRNDVMVENGVFTLNLSMQIPLSAFANRWLEIRVKEGSSASLPVALTPRQKIGVAPYAWRADRAAVVDWDGVLSKPAGFADGSDDGISLISTGAGLSGGPISSSGTIAVAAGGIGVTEINSTQVQRRIGGLCSGAAAIQQINEDGSVGCVAAGGAGSWSLAGNAGTNPATQFLGTTDNQSLNLRSNNQRVAQWQVVALSGPGGNGHTVNAILGGPGNLVTAGVRGATIAGGGATAGGVDPDYFGDGPNEVRDHYGTVSGGFSNRTGDGLGTVGDRAFATIGGGQGNLASGEHSTIAGGWSNTASATRATVAGGASNSVSGAHSTIAGGQGNSISTGQHAFIGGGFSNSASATMATVGGGNSNAAVALSSTVGGGHDNTASSSYATVAGGRNNTANAYAAGIGAGENNCAGGSYAWSGGRRGKVRISNLGSDPGLGCNGTANSADSDGDNGTFLWADSQDSDFVSSGPDQFLVRAQGGAVVTGSSGVNSPAGNRLRVDGLLRVDNLGAAGSQTLCRNASNQLSTCSSSVRYKTAIEDLGLGLEAVLNLRPVAYRWRDSNLADVGFVAEEVALIDERLVTRNESGAIEGVRYDRLSALLANAVRELAEARQRDAAALALLRDRQASQAHELATLRAEQDRLADQLRSLQASTTSAAKEKE